MIYPDDYKCLICKFRYYGCKYGKVKGVLKCSSFKVKASRPYKGINVAIARCLFGVCPRYDMRL